MAGIMSPMERVRQLVEELRRLENKLVNGTRMTMQEQQKTHNEIKKIKEQMARLERQVG